MTLGAPLRREAVLQPARRPRRATPARAAGSVSCCSPVCLSGRGRGGGVQCSASAWARPAMNRSMSARRQRSGAVELQRLRERAALGIAVDARAGAPEPVDEVRDADQVLERRRVVHGGPPGFFLGGGSLVDPGDREAIGDILPPRRTRGCPKSAERTSPVDDPTLSLRAYGARGDLGALGRPRRGLDVPDAGSCTLPRHLGGRSELRGGRRRPERLGHSS